MFRVNKKAQVKFDSLEYIFIDGGCDAYPWNEKYSEILLFLKQCLDANKKVHCCGIAHFASYYLITTNFYLPLKITTKGSIQNNKGKDYEYDSHTGNMCYKQDKIINSGVKIVPQKRIFLSKSSKALEKGLILPTKFHFAAFDSKSGDKLLNKVSFPMGFYWKGKLQCTSQAHSKAKVQVLIQA